jgi:hypothetical protein
MRAPGPNRKQQPCFVRAVREQSLICSALVRALFDRAYTRLQAICLLFSDRRSCLAPVRRAHRSPNRRGAAVAPKIKSGMETKTLRFQCPNTGLEVDSGISARCSTRLISIRVRYPICEKPHEWQVADGSFSSITYQPSSAQTALDQLGSRAPFQDVQGSTFQSRVRRLWS